MMPRNGGVRILIDAWPFVSTMFNQSTPAAWPHPSVDPKTNKKKPPVSFILAWYTWENEKNDNIWINEMKRALGKIQKKADVEGCTISQPPVYLNASLLDTPVSDIYRENLSNLRQLRKKYDPNDIMKNAGGFII
jgi:hypothetical protein